MASALGMEFLMRRYRCTNCGNITRFDVSALVRTKCFYHYSISGELEIEEPEEVSRVIEEVSCRWCATPKFIEVISEEQEPSALASEV